MKRLGLITRMIKRWRWWRFWWRVYLQFTFASLWFYWLLAFATFVQVIMLFAAVFKIQPSTYLYGILNPQSWQILLHFTIRRTIFPLNCINRKLSFPLIAFAKLTAFGRLIHRVVFFSFMIFCEWMILAIILTLVLKWIIQMWQVFDWGWRLKFDTFWNGININRLCLFMNWKLWKAYVVAMWVVIALFIIYMYLTAMVADLLLDLVMVLDLFYRWLGSLYLWSILCIRRRRFLCSVGCSIAGIYVDQLRFDLLH